MYFFTYAFELLPERRINDVLPVFMLTIQHDVPGGLVGYPRAYKNQFREFNSHRVHIRVLVGTFSQLLFLALKID